MRVMIASPCYSGQIDVEYVSSLVPTIIESKIKHGIEVHWAPISHESLITRARNYYWNEFLKSDCDVLAYIDSDIGWRPSDFVRLVQSEHEFVCGPYPMKNTRKPQQYVFNPLGPDAFIKDGFIEVKDAGTGFMFLKREAVNKLTEMHQDRVYDGQGPQKEKTPFLYEIFRTGIEDDIYLSEDYFLCRDWRQLGGKVMLDIHTQLTHSGRITFSGDLIRDRFDPHDPRNNSNNG